MTYMPRNGQMAVLPQRYRCKMVCDNYGDFPLSMNSGTYQFSFPINGMYLPYSNTVVTSGGAWTYNGQPHTIQQPVGFSQICNANTYRNYRVYSCKITVGVTSESPQDNLLTTITPSNAQGIPASCAAALGQPWTMKYTFQAGKGKSSLSNYMTVSKFFGVSQRSIEDDMSGSWMGNFGSNPILPLYWVVNIATEDQTILIAPISIRFHLEFYVELFGLANATVIQT